jgi:hypothetical protein
MQQCHQIVSELRVVFGAGTFRVFFGCGLDLRQIELLFIVADAAFYTKVGASSWP